MSVLSKIQRWYKAELSNTRSINSEKLERFFKPAKSAGYLSCLSFFSPEQALFFFPIAKTFLDAFFHLYWSYRCWLDSMALFYKVFDRKRIITHQFG